MSQQHAVHVIAEAGTNHGGELEVALQLVDIAAEAAADSVKFQVIYPEGLYLRQLRSGDSLADNEVFALRAAAQLPDEAWPHIAAHAREKGLGFSASVFDRRGLDLLDSLDADYVKLASCDLNNGPLIKAAAALGRRTIISTGMSSYEEVGVAVDQFEQAGGTDLVVLHCVSVYPCPSADTQLGALRRLADLGHPIGFSDHSESSIAASAALAIGATCIEKHFTFDRSAEGFDHGYAMEPAMFTSYIADLRSVSSSLASDRSEPVAAEVEVKTRARRGLWAAADLPAGTVLEADHVLVVRPEAAMAPNDLDHLLGRTLADPIRQSEAFNEGLLVPDERT